MVPVRYSKGFFFFIIIIIGVFDCQVVMGNI